MTAPHGGPETREEAIAEIMQEACPCRVGAPCMMCRGRIARILALDTICAPTPTEGEPATEEHSRYFGLQLIKHPDGRHEWIDPPEEAAPPVAGDAETEDVEMPTKLRPSIESVEAWLTSAKEIGFHEAIASVEMVEWLLARLRSTPEAGEREPPCPRCGSVTPLRAYGAVICIACGQRRGLEERATPPETGHEP